ncbi:hypothetical protein C0993_011702 [Termitomyces sp. T159_Od127]|nr:hypothetical protein C0993_011702 [Termitomyces sp. T159_Od127]
MAARRQPSTTSLSKYARANSPSFQNSSLDFCNAFWGPGDAGVDVLFARMRGATRTMEELRNYWKERAAIEEDYAKRLGKLAKSPLGRDEIGELRNTLDTIRLETDKQAGFHTTLAGQIRTDLENTAATFHSRQLQNKKTFQAAIEKEFKNKQAQEAHVNKAREKYEQDCVRINSYTAQSSLVQGKDLEKIQLKLERAQQSVQVNEREFANFAKAYQETVARWVQSWKTFADNCQDLELQRIEFMKDNMWAYANAVSTVCVADDEASHAPPSLLWLCGSCCYRQSCEKIRVALEQMEPEKDMENFVRDYGTGNQIPDPPAFVNYNTPDAIPSSSSNPTFHTANFIRTSQRESVPRQNSIPLQPDESNPPFTNAAGIGAGGGVSAGKRESQQAASLGRQASRRQPAVQQATQQPNGFNSQPDPARPGPSTSPSKQIARSSTQRKSISPASAPGTSASSSDQATRNNATDTRSSRASSQDPYAEPIGHDAEPYLKIGDNVYKVDPNRDPQMQKGGLFNGTQSDSPSPVKAIRNNAVDPLAKHMEDLKNAVSSTGSTRRRSVRRSTVPDVGKPVQHQQPGTAGSALSPTSSATVSNLTVASPTSTASSRDYRNSAEVIVGIHPSASTPAQPPRSVSPNPPTAAFMKPPPTSRSEVQDVLSHYQQSLPGERKSISRSNSPVALERRLSFSVPQQQQGHRQSSSQSSSGLMIGQQGQGQGQNLARPPSIVGHPGIGAHGGSRSNSPQPPSRGPSPAPPSSVKSRNSVVSANGNGFMSAPQSSGPGVARTPSPNTVGIALDPSGRVSHDEMAQRYQQQQQQQQNHQRQLSIHQQQTMPPPQQQQTRQQYVQQQPQQQYAPVQPPPQAQSQVHRTSYMPPPASTTPVPPPPPPINAYIAQHQARNPALTSGARTGYTQQAPVQAQQPMYTGYQTQTPALVQAAPLAMTVYQQPPPQQQQPQQAPYQQPQQTGYYGQQQHFPQQQQPQQQQLQLRAPYQQQQQQQYGGYRGPSPVMQRTPSPQPPPAGQLVAPPTGQVTEDGHGILFYVKALYDYTATIDEEFDFQAGDIIAVTHTPEDGWWSGELLDEERRQRGRHVFPSNFMAVIAPRSATLMTSKMIQQGSMSASGISLATK